MFVLVLMDMDTDTLAGVIGPFATREEVSASYLEHEASYWTYIEELTPPEEK